MASSPCFAFRGGPTDYLDKFGRAPPGAAIGCPLLDWKMRLTPQAQVRRLRRSGRYLRWAWPARLSMWFQLGAWDRRVARQGITARMRAARGRRDG
jgi:hypothetical protein